MGGQLSLLVETSASIGIFSYIDVLDNVHYISQINSSRFLKTCRALDPNGEIIIKVFVKPTEAYKLSKLKRKLIQESRILAPLPNVVNYSKLIESTRAAYLIRQYMKSNLYDRLSTRPYLQSSELNFITFQLLQAVKNIHELGVCHGDIKTENILVTSSNWIFLTDFSSVIKPIYLPEDNPSEFFFYFDTSKRRSCYIAPERFDSQRVKDVEENLETNYMVTTQMDIFSLGCCIAELYLEGRSLFDLSQLFKYKNEDYDINAILNEQIMSNQVKSLIVDMIHINPAERLSANELLCKYRGILFPECYYTFTYDYFRNLSTIGTSVPTSGEISAHTVLKDKMYILDECCDKIYNDFDKICSSLGYTFERNLNVDDSGKYIHFERYSDFNLSISSAPTPIEQINKINTNSIPDDSFVFFLSFLCHSLRNLVSRDSKIKALLLILLFSSFVPDEHKLNRIIPYFIALFEDTDPNVQAFSLRCLSEILNTIDEVTPLNENLFVDYLLPRIRKLLLTSKNCSYVRIVLSNCLSNLVDNASRFQDISIKSYSGGDSDDWITDLEKLDLANRYMKKLSEQIAYLTTVLLTDADVSVKKALLNNILSLCKFFGREKTNDIILSHLITYLNDKDPTLRIAFIELIPAISVFLGPISIQQYILPLLIQTITDTEELVVISVLKSLKDICITGLIDKGFYFDICGTVSPLLLHPNAWIRQFSLILIIEVSTKLTEAEVYCMLYPHIRAFFEFDVEFDFQSMISSCKQPLPRSVFDLLCTWSLRSSKSLFWKQIPNDSNHAFGYNNIAFITKDYLSKHYGFNKSVRSSKTVIKSYQNEELPLTAEDKNWIDKFIAMNFPEDEFWKLAILRGYVLRISKTRENKNNLSNDESNQYYIKRLMLPNVLPKTIFFDISYNCSEDTLITNNVLPSVNSKRVSGIIDNLNNEVVNNKSSIRKLNGSLVLPHKNNPTTTSNLENVIVHLQSKQKVFNPKIDYNQDDVLKSTPFVASNSYEGNEKSIRTYLEKYEIFYPLNKFQEFGQNLEIIANSFTISSYKSQLIINLIENDFGELSSSALLQTKIPILVCGSTQGTLKLWSMESIIESEFYFPLITYDCASGIVDLTVIPGYECFSVLTQDNNILVFRVLTKSEGINDTTNLHCIRKINLDTIAQNVSFMNITSSRIMGTECIIALSRCSAIYLFDVRTMKNISILKTPPEYGAILTFEVDNESELLIAGTTQGIICIWDLRFRVLIKKWSFGDHAPITKIKIFKEFSSNHIIIAGGSQHVYFTIWDYSRLQCKYAFIDSEKDLPINNFVATNINDSKRDENLNLTRIQEFYFETNGSNIFFTDKLANDVLMLDMTNINTLRSATSSSPKYYKCSSLKVNSNLTYIIRKDDYNSNTKVGNKFHKDFINSIHVANFKNNNILISSDNSGIINIFH